MKTFYIPKLINVYNYIFIKNKVCVCMCIRIVYVICKSLTGAGLVRRI